MKKEKLVKLILIGCLIVFGLGLILTSQANLEMIKDEGYKEQIDNNAWGYLVIMEFDQGNIGECSIDIDFYDSNNNVMLYVDNTSLVIEDNIVKMYYEIDGEAEEYVIKNYEVHGKQGVLNSVFSILTFASIIVIVGFNIYVKRIKRKLNNR